MLTFFRTIRKGLLGQGQTRRYIFYAIGEILLVMVGILLALQVNNWNEWRINKKKEIAILHSLKSGLEKDLIDLEGNIEIHERTDESCTLLIDYMNQGLPYHDSLAVHFNYTVGSSVFWHTTSAFQTLKSAGVDLISNSALRDEIINLYDGQYEFLHEVETQYVERISESTNIFLRSRFYDSYNFDFYHPQLLGNMVPVDYESLKNDLEYLYFLKSTKNFNKFFLVYVLHSTHRAESSSSPISVQEYH
jgi:hypothetical protein